jgi:hypothetical protein
MNKILKIIVVFFIYFSGYFVAYKYAKSNLMRTPFYKGWTVGLRNYALVLSVGSWISVVGMGLVDIIQSSSEDKTSSNF